MRVFSMGHVPAMESQLFYHALARCAYEGIILLSPASPYVCIGYHQDADQEVDLEYCRGKDIPVIRREVGGGAVFLDGQQLFYQIVLSKKDPLAVGDKETLYQRLLAPVVRTYADLGIETRYKPVNDIVTVDGRKISGNGAAEISGSLVLVGNLILDFDYETMARVLRVPDEKYRHKIYKSMYENLTTIRRELGMLPSEAKANAILTENFARLFGSLEPACLPEDVLQMAEGLRPLFSSEAWLYRRSRPPAEGREVQIAAGVQVIHRLRKTPGGLVRATLEIKDGSVESATITGDFFFYPEHKLVLLEDRLRGVALDKAGDVISSFYKSEAVESPGLTAQELADILRGVA